MPMQHVGCDRDQRPGLDRDATKLVRRDGRAADGGDRRIEAYCFINDGAGFDQPIGESINWTPLEFTFGFGCDTFAPYGDCDSR